MMISFAIFIVEVDPDSMEPKNNLSCPALDWCKEVGADNIKTVDDILADKNSKSFSTVSWALLLNISLL